MQTMTIPEAAEYFGISKEAIHNRIRRGSLVVELVDGVKMLSVDTDVKATPQPKAKPQTRKSTQASEERYYKLLEEQNAKLQSKVEKLEDETRTLRDQKEQMLIAERVKIEQIYKDKDEQLKNLLTTISSQFMLNAPSTESKEEHVEAEIEVQVEETAKEKLLVEDEIISLKKYLKEKKISAKKSDKIIAKFKKRAKKDKRITILGKKCYINLTKYDYSDLL